MKNMKSEIVTKESTEQTTYPCMKINQKTGLVVLFYERNCGVVIVTDSIWRVVGEQCDIFGEKEYFTPFIGEISLKVYEC